MRRLRGCRKERGRGRKIYQFDRIGQRRLVPPPATPTTTTTRPVKRRLDTLADIRGALSELDDYVSSDEDNLDGDNFRDTQILPSSDSEAFDLDDDDESSDPDDPEPVAPAPLSQARQEGSAGRDGTPSGSQHAQEKGTPTCTTSNGDS
ncbi:hypothetical protein Pcinc_003888 [Petrolisthes cinctipes]|uniref:Uncharacterized protein n=1 Tax=Petrolisthes cinctipes TaxID=88211 RepID=A0AAE1L242_PETCI|nr:hypothetical protein Pcinc_003888 [Petrolisthes cinctipes]